MYTSFAIENISPEAECCTLNPAQTTSQTLFQARGLVSNFFFS